MYDSDHEEEEERTIKSGQQKRLEALVKILDETKKHANINDFNNLDNDYQKLSKEIAKQKDLFAGDNLPKKVLKVFMLVEDSLNNVTNAEKKKMSKINATSFNKLK